MNTGNADANCTRSNPLQHVQLGHAKLTAHNKNVFFVH